MLEEYKNDIIEEINYLQENLEQITFKEIDNILEKIKKLIHLNELQKEVKKIFYYYIKTSYDKEDWRKAIHDNNILDIIYLTNNKRQQEEFFRRNMHNLANVLYVFERVLERIKKEEKEDEEENGVPFDDEE